MTKNDQTDQTHAYAQAVAKALGDGWTYNDADNRDVDGEWPRWAQIARTDGGGLHVSREWNTGRYLWSGEYPRDASGHDQTPYNAKRPSITVSPDKSPEQVARDITRRLVPDYLALLAQTRERIDRADAYANTARRNAVTLAKILDTVPGEHARQGDAAVRFHRGEFYGDVAVNGDSIRIDARSLTMAQAERVLRALMEETR